MGKIKKNIEIEISVNGIYCDTKNEDICDYSNYENPHCNLFGKDLEYKPYKSKRCKECIDKFGGIE
jgi:ligand-binding sensor protein